MSKCPGNTADAKTTCYFRVLINVTRIVVVNEVVPERLAKNKPGKHRQRKADADGIASSGSVLSSFSRKTNDNAL